MDCSRHEVLLSLENIHKSFGKLKVLENLTAQIKNLKRNSGETTGQIVAFIGPSGSGKALASDMPVLTETGWVPIGNLKKGDKVFGKSGICNVQGTYPQGQQQVYSVKFSDGSEVECTMDHLWFTETLVEKSTGKYIRTTKNPLTGEHSKKRKRYERLVPLNNGKVRSLAEIINKFKIWNHEIPIVDILDFGSDDSKLTIHPYLLGLLLGDGSFRESGVVSFMKPEQDLWEKAGKYLPKGDYIRPKKDVRYENGLVGFYITTKKRGRNCQSKTSDQIKELKLNNLYSHEKFVPEIYLRSSVQSRIFLLQGLLDTDGHTRNGTIHFASSSHQLYKDVVFLARSLGGHVHEGPTRLPKYSYNNEIRIGKISYRCTIAFENGIIPISSNKHLEKWTGKIGSRRRTIKSITKTRITDCVCISVDSPDNLYVTKDFILTHNTTVLKILADLIKPDKGNIYVNENRSEIHPGLFGLVPQNNLLFRHRTVISTLEIASMQKEYKGALKYFQAKSDARKKAEEMLNRFGLSDKSECYPAQLSGGQRQRVSIAQQVLCSEHFLLMDEPTTGLDPKSKKEVLKLIVEVANQDDLNTIILNTHDIWSALAVADTLLIMGRDRDSCGKIISGSRIVQELDLAMNDLAWHQNIYKEPKFLELYQKIDEWFEVL